MIRPNISRGNIQRRQDQQTQGIRSYAELQAQMHRDLLRQHPEWIDSDGNCPTCDEYDRRLAKLVSIFRTASLNFAQRAA
jgi:hypothetical protein